MMNDSAPNVNLVGGLDVVLPCQLRSRPGFNRKIARGRSSSTQPPKPKSIGLFLLSISLALYFYYYIRRQLFVSLLAPQPT